MNQTSHFMRGEIEPLSKLIGLFALPEGCVLLGGVIVKGRILCIMHAQSMHECWLLRIAPLSDGAVECRARRARHSMVWWRSMVVRGCLSCHMILQMIVDGVGITSHRITHCILMCIDTECKWFTASFVTSQHAYSI